MRQADGALHVADWGRPATPLQRAGAFALGVFDGQANLRDHTAGRLEAIVAASGFEPVDRLAGLPTVWGFLELLRAQASVSAVTSSTKPG